MFTRDQLFIGGTWQQPATTATIETISPFTEQVNGSVPDAQPADVDAAVSAARAAVDSGPWARMSGQERSEIMGKLSTLLQSRQDELASTITNEMGAPLAFSYMGQVFAATMVLDYFVDLASKFQFEELRNGVMGPAVVRKEPVGVAVGIVDHPEAITRGTSQLVPARRRHRRSGRARRGRLDPPRRTRIGCIHGKPPRRRQGLVHG